MAKKYLQLGNILKRLLFDRSMKPIDLAREVNLPPPTIHRLITGKSTRPYKSSLKPIADYFSVTIDELTGEKPFNTNQILTNEKTAHTTRSKICAVSLIPWTDLTQNQLLDKTKYDTIPFVGNISNQGYATTLEDSSMEPLFSCGSLLIFDPQKQFKDRSYVLVMLHETNTLVFRQLLIDLDLKYLKPLNPDLNVFKMRAIGEHDKIIATLIEARQLFDTQ